MRGRVLPVAILLLLITASLTLGLNACGGGTTATIMPPPPGKLEHVVVIFQENRTPDNLFQDPVLIIRESPTSLSSGTNSLGQTIPLSPIDLGTAGSNPQNYDLGHAHSAFVPCTTAAKWTGPT